ncbi:hypothetical protein [Aquimarina sp. 2201CG14-23]|uniref:hypothetical protein n=1 Tax=Aquimarina mycalae TaxID=3040073 RepID=UPI002477F2F8|nr:hypothetical protein [Aquimarina sp. 2201CG14-23]MDH7445235.1 hypothetical protein [Aquimarina sp. 2201CG14-23]
MIRNIVLLLLVVLWTSCNMGKKEEATTKKPIGWQIIYMNDDEGKALSGSLDDLKKAVRQGCEIRVGWGIYNEFRKDGLKLVVNVEHTAEAQFLTISKGHVFAQIDRIMGQAPSRGAPQIQLIKSHYWHSVLGTTGEMNQVYLDHSNVEKSDTYIDDVKMIWYVNVNDCDYALSEAKELY